MHGSGDYFSLCIFSALKEKYVLGKGCFQDLCLEDFAMVCLGSLGKMGGGWMVLGNWTMLEWFFCQDGLLSSVV